MAILANRPNTYGEFLRGRILTLLRDDDNLIGGNVLGTYRTPDGEVFDGIYVGDPPKSFTPSGLECIILELPISEDSYQMGNPDGRGRATLTGLWQLHLRQHLITEQTSLFDEQQQQNRKTIVEGHYRFMAWFAECKSTYEPLGMISTQYAQTTYIVPYTWRVIPLGSAVDT